MAAHEKKPWYLKAHTEPKFIGSVEAIIECPDIEKYPNMRLLMIGYQTPCTPKGGCAELLTQKANEWQVPMFYKTLIQGEDCSFGPTN